MQRNLLKLPTLFLDDDPKFRGKWEAINEPMSQMQQAPYGDDGPDRPHEVPVPQVRQGRSDDNGCREMGGWSVG
jgi:hypothetical protein